MQDLMPAALHDEAADADRHALRLHLESCPECAALWAEYQTLGERLSAARSAAEPSAALLARCRARLSAALEAEPAPARRGWERPRGAWREIWRAAWGGWKLGPAPAALLLLVGLALGAWAGRPAGPAGSGAQATPAGADGFSENAATLALTPAALWSGGTAGPMPVRVDAVQAAADGQVRVTFDALRRATVVAPATEPAMRRLLLFAAQHPLNSGVRINTVDALGASAADGAVQQLLIEALREDPNPGVRLQALQALAPRVADSAEARLALAETVLNDANPGLRGLAVAALGRAPRPEADAILAVVGRQSRDAAVRLRCAELLRQLDPAASLPTDLSPQELP